MEHLSKTEKIEVDFDIDSWREVLSFRRDDPGQTVNELADSFGVGRRAVRKRLHKGIQEGTIIKGVRFIHNRKGSLVPVPVYQIKGHI